MYTTRMDSRAIQLQILFHQIWKQISYNIDIISFHWLNLALPCPRSLIAFLGAQLALYYQTTAGTDVHLCIYMSCTCSRACRGVFISISVYFLPSGTRCSWGLPLLQRPKPDHQGWRRAFLLELCGPSAGTRRLLHLLTIGKTTTTTVTAFKYNNGNTFTVIYNDT